jgi:hypothetical protein
MCLCGRFVSVCVPGHAGVGSSYLECVFAGETLVAVAAGEWFHCQVNALVSLQVVIAVETLRALIALEGPVIYRLGLLGVCAVNVLHVGRVATVEATEAVHAVDERQAVARVADVREHGSRHRIAIWSLVRVWRLRWCGRERGNWSRRVRRRHAWRSCVDWARLGWGRTCRVWVRLLLRCCGRLVV